MPSILADEFILPYYPVYLCSRHTELEIEGHTKHSATERATVLNIIVAIYLTNILLFILDYKTVSYNIYSLLISAVDTMFCRTEM